MSLVWSARSLSDLSRLYRFLAPKNRRAAANVVKTLRSAAAGLVDYPKLGERLDRPGRREVRRIFIGDYELRYELKGRDVHVAGVWHVRENR